jgi:hypothetical protein
VHGASKWLRERSGIQNSDRCGDDMPCYRCKGALRYDREAPYCVMCGRFQYPDKIREWNEQALKKAEKAAPKFKDFRTIEEIEAEIEREEMNKRKSYPRHGITLGEAGKDLALSRFEREQNRVHMISAGVAPRNRIGEGR